MKYIEIQKKIQKKKNISQEFIDALEKAENVLKIVDLMNGQGIGSLGVMSTLKR